MDRHDSLPDLRVHTCGWWGFFGSGPLIRPLGMVSLKESCLLLLPRHKHKGYFCRVLEAISGLLRIRQTQHTAVLAGRSLRRQRTST